MGFNGKGMEWNMVHDSTRLKCQVSFVYACQCFIHILISYLVICPAFQIHLPDFGQGSTVQPSEGDDIEMDDSTIPLAPFEDAEGDDAYVEAVKQAVTDQ